MPSSRDLSSPTDVYSPDDASDKGIVIYVVIYDFISFCLFFCMLTIGISCALLLCRFVGSAMFSS